MFSSLLSQYYQGLGGFSLSLTLREDVFAEDLSGEGNADAGGGKKLTRDADNRPVHTM
jgi:hypothetical protein